MNSLDAPDWDFDTVRCSADIYEALRAEADPPERLFYPLGSVKVERTSLYDERFIVYLLRGRAVAVQYKGELRMIKG